MNKDIAKEYVDKIISLEESIKDLLSIPERFDDNEVFEKVAKASGEFLTVMYFDGLRATVYKQYPELDRTGAM